jgi:hypothetical protein
MSKGVVRNSQLVTFLPRYAALREIANGELNAVPLQERDLAHTSISLITLPSAGYRLRRASYWRFSSPAWRATARHRVEVDRRGSGATHVEARTVRQVERPGLLQ